MQAAVVKPLSVGRLEMKLIEILEDEVPEVVKQCAL